MTVKLPGLPTRLPMLPVKVGPASRTILLDRHTPAQATSAAPKRRRIWELSSNFHCSIIGTCLTTAELRQILIKMQQPGAHKESDHQLHGYAVLLSGHKDAASKLLQKSLGSTAQPSLNSTRRAVPTNCGRCGTSRCSVRRYPAPIGRC